MVIISLHEFAKVSRSNRDLVVKFWWRVGAERCSHVEGIDNTLVLFPGHTFRQVVRPISFRLDGEVVIIFAYGREGGIWS